MIGWDGWGTALKPGWEPIIVARKPFKGGVKANVERYGTGAMNIDGCRLGGEPWARNLAGNANESVVTDYGLKGVDKQSHDLGRWPANVLLDEEAAALLDEQSGELGVPGNKHADTRQHKGGVFAGGRMGPDNLYFDTGGASRFFYVAKPDRSERDHGCEALPAKTAAELTGRKPGSAGLQNPRAGIRVGSMNRDVQARVARNSHPTVKPVDLMRWLVRLVTPPNGTVLDPFCGSGTTGMACLYEGFNFIGCEREVEYREIARARIGAVAPLLAHELTA